MRGSSGGSNLITVGDARTQRMELRQPATVCMRLVTSFATTADEVARF